METLTQEAPAVLETDTLIASLKASLAEANNLIAALRDERDQWQARLREHASKVSQDCQTLSEKLMEEANRRNWCEEYDEIVEALNGQFSVLAITERTREFEIEVLLTATVTASTTVVVSATSRDDAEDQIRSDPDSYVDVSNVLTNALYHGCDDLEIDFR